MRGVQTHSGPPVFSVPFRKDLARMNGTPQLNQKILLALGIEPGSLDHESQPLSVDPFLIFQWGGGVHSIIRLSPNISHCYNAALGFISNPAFVYRCESIQCYNDCTTEAFL